MKHREEIVDDPQSRFVHESPRNGDNDTADDPRKDDDGTEEPFCPDGLVV